MASGTRIAVVVAALLIAAPRAPVAASDCSGQVANVQQHLLVFDTEAKQMGSGFLRDDALGVSLEAVKRRLDALGPSERSSPGWSGLREAEDARNRLVKWDERLTIWAEGIGSYRKCLKSPGCSIGDVITEQERRDRPLADWLKSLGDEGLDGATQKAAKAADLVNTFTTMAGSRATGSIASALTCLAEDGPRALPVAVQAPIAAQAPTIDHRPVGCVAAEKFPQFEARFLPADSIATARVLFSGKNPEDWYSVAMKSEGTAFVGVLPKPKKSLKAFRYYIEVTDRSLRTSRTADLTTNVVGSASECKGKLMAGTLVAASVLLAGPAGAAAVPIGFASTGVVVAGSAAAASSAAGSAGGAGGGMGGLAVVGGVVAAAAGVAVAASAIKTSADASAPTSGGSCPSATALTSGSGGQLVAVSQNVVCTQLLPCSSGSAQVCMQNWCSATSCSVYIQFRSAGTSQCSSNCANGNTAGLTSCINRLVSTICQ